MYSFSLVLLGVNIHSRNSREKDGRFRSERWNKENQWWWRGERTIERIEYELGQSWSKWWGFSLISPTFFISLFFVSYLVFVEKISAGVVMLWKLKGNCWITQRDFKNHWCCSIWWLLQSVANTISIFYFECDTRTPIHWYFLIWAKLSWTR